MDRDLQMVARLDEEMLALRTAERMIRGAMTRVRRSRTALVDGLGLDDYQVPPASLSVTVIEVRYTDRDGQDRVTKVDQDRATRGIDTTEFPLEGSLLLSEELSLTPMAKRWMLKRAAEQRQVSDIQEVAASVLRQLTSESSPVPTTEESTDPATLGGAILTTQVEQALDLLQRAAGQPVPNTQVADALFGTKEPGKHRSKDLAQTRTVMKAASAMYPEVQYVNRKSWVYRRPTPMVPESNPALGSGALEAPADPSPTAEGDRME